MCNSAHMPGISETRGPSCTLALHRRRYWKGRILILKFSGPSTLSTRERRTSNARIRRPFTMVAGKEKAFGPDHEGVNRVGECASIRPRWRSAWELSQINPRSEGLGIAIRLPRTHPHCAQC